MPTWPSNHRSLPHWWPTASLSGLLQAELAARVTHRPATCSRHHTLNTGTQRVSQVLQLHHIRAKQASSWTQQHRRPFVCCVSWVVPPLLLSLCVSVTRWMMFSHQHRCFFNRTADNDPDEGLLFAAEPAMISKFHYERSQANCYLLYLQEVFNFVYCVFCPFLALGNQATLSSTHECVRVRVRKNPKEKFNFSV